MHFSSSLSINKNYITSSTKKHTFLTICCGAVLTALPDNLKPILPDKIASAAIYNIKKSNPHRKKCKFPKNKAQALNFQKIKRKL